MRDYVEAGVQEINEKTDLHIKYKLNTEKGRGNRYSSITFFIDKKKDIGSKSPKTEEKKESMLPIEKERNVLNGN